MVVFLDGWVAYSPTTINLCDLLAQRSTVTLACPARGLLQREGFRRPYLLPVRNPSLVDSLLNFAWSAFGGRHTERLNRIETWIRAAVFYWVLRDVPADEVVAVDVHALLVAALRYGRAHLVSLELGVEPWLEKALSPFVSSVVTQSDARLRFLGLNGRAPAFLVPNAPIHQDHQVPERSRGDLVFAGLAWEPFGLPEIVDLLAYRQDLRLTIKGFLPSDQLEMLSRRQPGVMNGNRISIDASYCDQLDLTKTLSSHRIGLCLYNLEKVAPQRRFNFEYVPSGKLLSYLSAGLPVVGTRLPGMTVVREFGAGVLVDNHDQATLAAAIDEIESKYDSYCSGALRAARSLSFERHAEPFLSEVLLPV